MKVQQEMHREPPTEDHKGSNAVSPSPASSPVCTASMWENKLSPGDYSSEDLSPSTASTCSPTPDEGMKQFIKTPERVHYIPEKLSEDTPDKVFEEQVNEMDKFLKTPERVHDIPKTFSEDTFQRSNLTGDHAPPNMDSFDASEHSPNPSKSFEDRLAHTEEFAKTPVITAFSQDEISEYSSLDDGDVDLWLENKRLRLLLKASTMVVKEKDDALTKLEKKSSFLAKELAKNKNGSHKLQMEIDSLESRLEQSEKEKRFVKKRQDFLANALKEAAAQIELLKAESKTAQKEKQQLQKKLESKSEKKDAVKKSESEKHADAVPNENQILATALKQSADKIKSLKAKTKTAQKQTERLAEESDVVQNENQILATALKQSADQIKSLKAETKAAQKQTELLAQELARSKEETKSNPGLVDSAGAEKVSGSAKVKKLQAEINRKLKLLRELD